MYPEIKVMIDGHELNRSVETAIFAENAVMIAFAQADETSKEKNQMDAFSETMQAIKNAIEKSADDRVLNHEECVEITNHIKRRIARCLGKKPNKPMEAMLLARAVKAIEDEYGTLNKIQQEDLADVHELIDCWNPED